MLRPIINLACLWPMISTIWFWKAGTRVSWAGTGGCVAPRRKIRGHRLGRAAAAISQPPRLRLRHLLAVAGNRRPAGLADLVTNAGNEWLGSTRWIATLLLYPVLDNLPSTGCTR